MRPRACAQPCAALIRRIAEPLPPLEATWQTAGMARSAEARLAGRVLVIRPTYFGHNPETAGSNAMQKSSGGDADEVRRRALGEWEGLVAGLRARGVEVLEFDDTAEPYTPDACFPNNWISCHADGTIVLYPLLAVNRRLEYRQDIVDHLRTLEPYSTGRILDLRQHAQEGRFLEGTGSLVLDRAARTAFAALSARTHRSVAEEWAREMEYELVCFHAQDARGDEVYHTNVMMSVGDGLALVCLDAVRDAAERQRLEAALSGAGHEVLGMDLAQLDAFVGNCLFIEPQGGSCVVAMSERAGLALRPEQRAHIAGSAVEVIAALGTMEHTAGGGVRCCLTVVP